MADREMIDGFEPSIFDKLTDPESAGDKNRVGYSEQQLMDVVRRDVEELLNTRRPTVEDLGVEHLPHVSHSVYTFGLPDFINFGTLSAGDRLQIGQQISRAVEFFEPRLKDIEITVKDPHQMKEQLKGSYLPTALYFHISARLRKNPCPPVTFETILELTQGRHRVEGEIGAEM